MDNCKSFKVALVGDARVGKTSFVSKNLKCEFADGYLPTVGCETTSLPFMIANHGHIVFNIWDIAGNHPEACAEYLKDSDAAIIMFDPAQQPSFEDVVIWHRELLSANPSGPPIIVCTFKPIPDGQHRKMSPETISWPSEMGPVHFYDISSDPSLLEAPFLRIAQLLLNDPSAEFETTRVCHPRRPAPSTEEVRKLREDMERCENESLPDAEEDDL